MSDLRKVAFLEDNGGRRLGLDRRRLWIPAYCPERRSGHDRRGGLERRSGKASFLDSPEPKRKTDEYVEVFGSIRGLFQGICFGVLLWEIIIITIVVIRIS
jgi:hypothetical protein